MDPDTDSSASERLDQEDDQGWEDVEDDTEDIKVISLFDDKTFSNAKEMLEYCKTKHGFDIWKTQREMSTCFFSSPLLGYLLNLSRA
jgi:type I protein arginine methyltransferase